MRLNIYKQIDQMLNSVMEAINYINNNDNFHINNQLLNDSKSVLNSIDLVLTNNYDSISDTIIFEQIKKCINFIDDLLGSSFSFDKEKIMQLDNYVKELQIMFRKNVKYKIRVVFFAELGQKWDSMSSVYEAFKKRDDCEVRVVLTPIFRKTNINGQSRTEVIYDDYLTDLGIKFLHYKEYDISKDLPDMAFISNPYEGVTIKEFWPENIAKHTKLIYLPYFTGIFVDDIFIESFYKLNVNKYAWKIIAQSEKQEELQKLYSNGDKEKFLYTGLPKWDEEFKFSENMKVEDFWLEKTKGKKVFLWNTHYNVDYYYSTLLEYGESIINYFEKRDDLALIWRPHPMTETIFKLYKPELKSHWDNLTEKVLSSKNMILDLNKSYSQSFYLSDALISDFSSMIVQYVFTRKPIIWIRKETTRQFFENKESLVRIDKIKRADQFKEIVDFINEVTKNRNYLKDINFGEFLGGITEIDGKIGERVCNKLIDELIKENIQY